MNPSSDSPRLFSYSLILWRIHFESAADLNLVNRSQQYSFGLMFTSGGLITNMFPCVTEIIQSAFLLICMLLWQMFYFQDIFLPLSIGTELSDTRKLWWCFPHWRGAFWQTGKRLVICMLLSSNRQTTVQPPVWVELHRPPFLGEPFLSLPSGYMLILREKKCSRFVFLTSCRFCVSTHF